MAREGTPFQKGSKTSYPKGGKEDARAKGEAIPKTDREKERQEFKKNEKGGRGRGR